MTDTTGAAARWAALHARLRPFSPFLGMLAIVVFLYRDLVFRGHVLFYGDTMAAVYPWFEALARIVAAGQLPVWNPDISFGQPLWATPNYQLLYPFTWLSFFVRPWTYLTMLVTTHTLGSGLGFYVLGRWLRLTRWSSFLAAAVWMTSGPFLSLLNLPNHFVGTTWLPWILAAAVQAVRSRRVTHWLLWGGALAVPILAGTPESALLGVVLSVVYVLSRLHARSFVSGRTLRLASEVALGSAFAVLLAAAQWVPAVEAAARSTRWTMTQAEQRKWSLPPLALIQAAVPVFFDALPLEPAWRSKLSTPGRSYLLSIYCGLPALLLALLGACLSRRRLRLWLVALACVAALVALGSRGGLYDLALLVAPPLRLLRYPAKALIAVSFAVALLAGFGGDALLRRTTPQRRLRWTLAICVAVWMLLAIASVVMLGPNRWSAAWLAGDAASLWTALAPTHWRMTWSLSLAAVAAFAAWRLGRSRGTRWALALLALAVISDTTWTHRALNPTAPPALVRFRPPIVDVLRKDGAARLHVVDDPAPPHARPMSTVPWAAAVEIQTYVLPFTGVLHGLAGSYDYDLVGLYPQPLVRLTDLVSRLGDRPEGLRLLRLGAVDHVVTRHHPEFSSLTPIATLSSLYPDAVRVYRVPDPLPRVYAAARARCLDDDDAMPLLLDSGVDLRQEVILPPGCAPASGPDVSATIRVLSRQADRIRVAATLSTPAYVVFVEGYDPNWRATVDGNPAPVLRANLAFRAVSVPAGRHVVDCVYRPRSIVLGMAGSLAALVAAGLIVWRKRRRRALRVE